MKNQHDISELLAKFENIYKLPVMQAQQGSAAWHTLKLGVISASSASKAVAKLDSETRATYMAELVAQICTGISEEISSKAIDWGNQNEDAARSTYEFATGSLITQVPFVFLDDKFREGCSPDGLLDNNKCLEIKCPFNSVHYVKFFTEDKIKAEYDWQAQYQLRILGAEAIDFVQYDPRMKSNPMKILTVKRDAAKQAKFDELIPLFIEDMETMLAKVGIKFGEQWTRLVEPAIQITG